MTIFSKAEELSSPSLAKGELGLAESLGLLLLQILRALGARDLGLLLADRSSRPRCCLSLLGGRGLGTLCFDIWQRGGRILRAELKSPKVLVIKVVYLQGGKKLSQDTKQKERINLKGKRM